MSSSEYPINAAGLADDEAVLSTRGGPSPMMDEHYSSVERYRLTRAGVTVAWVHVYHDHTEALAAPAPHVLIASTKLWTDAVALAFQS